MAESIEYFSDGQYCVAIRFIENPRATRFSFLVQTDGVLKVTVPLKATKYHARCAISRNTGWIARQLGWRLPERSSVARL